MIQYTQCTFTARHYCHWYVSRLMPIGDQTVWGWGEWGVEIYTATFPASRIHHQTARTSWQIDLAEYGTLFRIINMLPPPAPNNIINIIKYNLHFSCWSNCLSVRSSAVDPSTSEYFRVSPLRLRSVNLLDAEPTLYCWKEEMGVAFSIDNNCTVT